MGGMGVATCPWQVVRLGAAATRQEGTSRGCHPPGGRDNYNSSVDPCDRPVVCKPACVRRRKISGVQVGLLKWFLRAAGS